MNDRAPLPTGWSITTSIESVPDPNEGTPAARGEFLRRTYTCHDGLGNYIASSGVESDCYAQALSVAQSRGRP